MVLKIIKDNKIKSNQRHLEKFLEKYHDNPKQFTIDCESINVDYFNSDSIVTIRHRKPSRESIYYTNILKDKDEYAYFFGLARDPVISTSSYMDMGAQIVPKLVAILNTQDSSKSSLVFAEDSEEFNNVILLRIDCSQLSDLELNVLKSKNKLTWLENGKGFIKFGAIGDFNTLRNIRNFISNVDFEYDNGIYAKIIRVSIPADSQSLKPDSDVLRDRFYNFNKSDSSLEEVIDTNLEEVTETNLEEVRDSNLEEVRDSNLEQDKHDSEVSLNEITILRAKDYPKSNNEISSNQDIKSDSYYEYDSYKTFLIDDNEFYLEMSIPKDDFFKIIKLLHTFVDSYICELNQIEVLDIGDGLLNITSSILTNDNENVKIIEDILINYDFKSL